MLIILRYVQYYLAFEYILSWPNGDRAMSIFFVSVNATMSKQDATLRGSKTRSP